ncbi:hypothetical protein J5X84_12450 [Streptosporangiaceae bacterium NEAU-GS5]|nr:hypothetical protein [Streptosporangiaceae bacterium NEAU-GS5]
MLLLDVDGVLNPQRRPSPDFLRFDCAVDGGIRTVLLSEKHGRMLLDLARTTAAELVWATPWGDNANLWIAPRLGLSRLPVVPLVPGARMAPQVVAYAQAGTHTQARPYVWFTTDDERLGEGLTIGVDPRYGLTDAHLDEARRWLLSGLA